MAVEYVATGSAGRKRTVPIIGQRIFEAEWLPVAKQLGLDWVELMGTAGFDVTQDIRDGLMVELGKLREWIEGAATCTASEIESIDRLRTELARLSFESGEVAYIG